MGFANRSSGCLFLATQSSSSVSDIRAECHVLGEKLFRRERALEALSNGVSATERGAIQLLGYDPRPPPDDTPSQASDMRPSSAPQLRCSSASQLRCSSASQLRCDPWKYEFRCPQGKQYGKVARQ